MIYITYYKNKNLEYTSNHSEYIIQSPSDNLRTACITLSIIT